ncbi:MAG: GNAT family N-acetyltransferase [Negativicutes bacterium]|jgi:GNAT superfamily N-acetyltransferase
MPVYTNRDKHFEARPLTQTNWNDFVTLLGERGACGGCWCMSWRLKKAEFERQKGEQNKEAIRQLVEAGQPLGVLGYIDGQPVGWCSVAPREQFVRLQYSRTLQPIDDQLVWSIVCIFLGKNNRRQGLSTELIKAAVEYCRLQGGSIVEAYPAVPYGAKVPAAFLWTGVPQSYLRAGFAIAKRCSKWKQIMRYPIENILKVLEIEK